LVFLLTIRRGRRFLTGFLTWFAPAVVIPLALLAVCIAEFRSETRPASTPTSATPAAPAYT
jgi:hypothetical protein